MQFDLFGALRLDDLSPATLDQIAFLRDSPPHRVVLSAQDRAPLEPASVDRAVLRPLQLICRDIVADSGQSVRYVVRSAMHKEVRRGDVISAARWARIMQLIDGEPAVRQYARRLLFEETRDVALALSWRGMRGVSGERMIRALAAAPKKWRLPVLQAAECGTLRLLSYPDALRAPPLTPGEIDRLIDSDDLSLSAAYRLQWRVMLSAEPSVAAHLRESLRRRAAGGADAVLAAGNEAYLDEVLLERLCGVIDPTAGEPGPDRDAPLDDRVLTLPPRRAYIYDAHTRPGRRRLATHLPELAPGVPMPPGLDLRWSGMARGAAWRACATDLTAPWEDVPIPAPLWSAAEQADAFYYEKLYREAGLMGFPFPRSSWQSRET
jgi:hypothetical protein